MRATTTATIAFGLVAIPVKVYLGAESEDIHFHRITADGHRTGNETIDKVTGARVAPTDLRKGFEFSKDQFVLFDDDEVKALEGVATKAVDIREFVPLDTVDHRHVEKTYYLGPDRGGDKAYALLAETLDATSRCAVAQWSNRQKLQLVVLRAWRTAKGLGLIMHQLFYADEVRNADDVFDLAATVPLSEPERNIAKQLVDQLSQPAFDASRYEDTLRAQIRAAIDAKVGGRQVTVAAAAPNAAIIDVFEALKRSLATPPAVASKAPAVAKVEPTPAQAKRRRAS